MSVGIVRKIKGLGGLLTAWAFVLACIREIWKIGRAVIGYFSRSVAWLLVNDNGSQNSKIRFALYSTT